jgi:hypothetical protein
MKTAAFVCLLSAVALQYARDRIYPRADPQVQEIMYVHSPAAMTRLALGFDALAADVYWIRAIQNYGRQRLAAPGVPRDYSLLHPLLDLTTTLDPYFGIAYRFGAIFLSEPPPGGPGRPDLAIALLRKGIAAQPQKWQYFHDIGFVHYWAFGDAAAAASWFQRAGRQPGAPNWLLPVAAAMLTEGSDRESARYLWQQMLAAREEWVKRRAELALAQLDALDQLDALNALSRQTPAGPDGSYSWGPIVRAGRLRGTPVDPAGVPYVLDPATGRVRLSEGSPLHPLPAAGVPR